MTSRLLWDYAYESDPVSIFGGIVVLNREVDAATAEEDARRFLLKSSSHQAIRMKR